MIPLFVVDLQCHVQVSYKLSDISRQVQDRFQLSQSWSSQVQAGSSQVQVGSRQVLGRF